MQKTLIDGRVYFDRDKDLAGRATLEKEKKDLLEKAKKKQDEEKKAAAKKTEDKKAEEKKPDEKKPEEKKPEETKPEDKPKPPQGDAGEGGAL